MTAPNIINFPRYNMTSVPDALKELVRRIESGSTDARRVVVVIETNESQVDYRAFGDDFTRAHAAGMCLAIANHLAQGLEPTWEAGR